MSETGMLRRLDELGRIVIPKGIRSRLHMNEGDRLEMFVNDREEIVVRKYSLFQGKEGLLSPMLEQMSHDFQKDILLVSNAFVICGFGDHVSPWIGKGVSRELIRALEDRKNVALENFMIVPGEERVNALLFPMAKNSEVIGGILFLNGRTLDETQSRILAVYRNVMMNILYL